jgi:hypothetical protein
VSDSWYFHSDGRILRQKAVTEAELEDFVRLARKIADTAQPARLSKALCEAVLAIHDSLNCNAAFGNAEAERFWPVVAEVQTFCADTDWASMLASDSIPESMELLVDAPVGAAAGASSPPVEPSPDAG